MLQETARYKRPRTPVKEDLVSAARLESLGMYLNIVKGACETR